jgi:hypothetical protein
MRRSGKSARAVAEAFGISHTQVARVLRKGTPQVKRQRQVAESQSFKSLDGRTLRLRCGVTVELPR